MRSPQPTTSPTPAAPRRWALLALAALFLAALAPLVVVTAEQPESTPEAEAAEPETAPAELFVDTLRVDVVDVDVYVTDRDGHPVTGLTADDFEVFEDGRPVKVTNFYAVEGGRPVAGEPDAAAAQASPAAGGEEGAPAPPVNGARPSPGLPDDQRLWLVVYVDNFNVEPLQRNRILPSLRSFVYGTLGPGDRGMVVTYDRTLEVRQPFTEDPVLLGRALDGLEDLTGHLSARHRQRADVLRIINDTENMVKAAAAARSYADSVMNDLELTARGLQELIDSLAGLPGRKALLYVSSGLPLVAGEEMFHLVEGKFPSSYALRGLSRYDVSRRFERLAARASSNRVAFYTLDAAGLRVHTLGTAEYPELTTLGMRMHLDAVLQESVQSGLRFIAQESGGSAIVNVNEPLPLLDRIGEQLGTFYSLGYPATGDGDGRYHRIEVEVKRKGVRVRHREGYRSKSTEDRLGESVRAALMHSYESNDLGVEVKVGAAERHQGSLWRVPVQVAIPLADVAFLPRPDGRYEARLRLFVGAVDENGRFSEVEEVPLGVRVAAEDLEALRGESYLYPHRLLARGGRQRVAFAVHDELGATTSLVWRQLRVGG